MPTLPVFPIEEREANTQHASDRVTVPANLVDTNVEFVLDFDLVNEPSTTKFEFVIQWRPNAATAWRPYISTSWSGFDGIVPPKLVGKAKSSVEEILKGSHVRAIVSFTSLNDDPKTFGVTANTF